MSTSATLFHRQDTVVLWAMSAVFLGALGYGGIWGALGLALVIGAVLMTLALCVALTSKGGHLSQWCLPALGMAMVALMIHVARGHSETHFAVFAFLACLVVYRSQVPILVGAAVIALHHLSFNQMQTLGFGPICFTEPSFMRVIEHAIYVVVETIVLLLLAKRARADFMVSEELYQVVNRIEAEGGHVRLQLAGVQVSSEAGQKLLTVLHHIDEAIMQMSQSSSSIREASERISQGNQSLNERTIDAAMRLTQTSDEIREVVASLRSSEEKAHAASALSAHAAQVAIEGEQAVNRMMDTMSGIQQSSRKITDIIGVIDSIAFQTNILALNAAVEAARAGDQGRGFAVVASEVRHLAHRSAEAAREIKNLIITSVQQVDDGSALIGGTGEVVSSVMSHVQRVHQLIDEISDSSRLQYQVMEQIDATVARLDETTAINADMVRETTQAAAHLRSQAHELTVAVAVFGK